MQTQGPRGKPSLSLQNIHYSSLSFSLIALITLPVSQQQQTGDNLELLRKRIHTLSNPLLCSTERLILFVLHGKAGISVPLCDAHMEMHETSGKGHKKLLMVRKEEEREKQEEMKGGRFTFHSASTLFVLSTVRLVHVLLDWFYM